MIDCIRLPSAGRAFYFGEELLLALGVKFDGLCFRLVASLPIACLPQGNKYRETIECCDAEECELKLSRCPVRAFLSFVRLH